MTSYFKDVQVVNNIGINTVISLLVSFIFGMAILFVYVLSNRNKRLDDSLTEVIPLLTVLLAVMMQVDGTVQAVTFFGIFGVLSIVRFRSVLTDQKGIAFILFAVIMGVFVGTRQYTLSVLSFIILSTMVLLLPKLLPNREFVKVRFQFSNGHKQKTTEILTFLKQQKLKHTIVQTSGVSSIKQNGKTRQAKMELCIEIIVPKNKETVDLYMLLNKLSIELETAVVFGS